VGARGLNLLGALSGRTLWQGGRKSAAVAIRHGFVSGGERGDLVPRSQTLYCSGVLLGAWAASLLQRLVVDGRRRQVEDDPRW
jgi:hypothetical protein